MREKSPLLRFSRLWVPRNNRHDLWRRLLLVLTIGAFAQQSYLTQTHIHIPPTLAAAGSSSVLGGVAGHGKTPPGDDPAHCPLCQEILLAGAFLTPVAIAIPPPVLPPFRIALPAPALPFVAAVSHGWRGRAPPQA